MQTPISAPDMDMHRAQQNLIPTMNLENSIVGWERQDDPEMPLNFRVSQKWRLISVLTLMTTLTPVASSILSPAVTSLSTEFHNESSIIGSFTLSIYLLGYAIGPLFLAPLSEIYGRRLVLTFSNIFFCIWQLACALAPNIGGLIVFRFMTGIGGSGCLALGGGVVSDLFLPDQRGLAMGVWTLGTLFGPSFGPLVGGLVTDSIGWRWNFWILLSLSIACTILLEIMNQETNHRVLIDRKVVSLQRQLGRNDLRSCYSGSTQDSGTGLLKNGFSRPIRMLVRSPIVLASSLCIAFTYAILYLFFTTVPQVFEETYGFSTRSTGFIFLSLGAGNILGWITFTRLSDLTVIKLTRGNHGIFEPEMRLEIGTIFGCFLPITLFLYGWTTYYQVHWIVPILSLIPYGFGGVGVFLTLATYLVDSYPAYAASSLAANTVLRSLFGAFLPLAGPSMYGKLGLGWGNSLLGLIRVCIIPVPWTLQRTGGKLRSSKAF